MQLYGIIEQIEKDPRWEKQQVDSVQWPCSKTAMIQEQRHKTTTNKGVNIRNDKSPRYRGPNMTTPCVKHLTSQVNDHRWS